MMEYHYVKINDKYPHQIYVSGEFVGQALFDWLEENIGEDFQDWALINRYSTPLCNTVANTPWAIGFKQKDKAMMFKLGWTNDNRNQL